jgi:DNA replication and repair protein RecF
VYIEHLSLTDFRSYQQLDTELAPGVTVFVGPNGVGKTNIVEAIGYLASLSSHRVSTDKPLIGFSAERALVRGKLVRGVQRTSVEVEINAAGANRARINRANPVRARAAAGILKTVLFAPEDLALVKGDPAVRRRYLDEVLVTLVPHQAALRADYERVLKQRNALLKSARAAGRFSGGHEATLEVWDQHLAETGARLLHARLGLVERLQPHQRFLEALVQHRKKELDRGISLVGPHRDELSLMLGPAPAKGYASHGETWSMALALRLASYYLLNEEDQTPGATPVLILDDVFAELDTQRRRKLAKIVSGAEQVLVTAAVPGDIPEELAGRQLRVVPGGIDAEAG